MNTLRQILEWAVVLTIFGSAIGGFIAFGMRDTDEQRID